MYGNPRGGTFYTTEYLDTWGQTPQWDDLRFPASALRQNPATSKPDYDTWLGTLRSFTFDAASEEGVFFNAQLPHGFKYGTKIRFHTHWAPLTAPTNGQTVRWGLNFSMAQQNGVFPGASLLGPVGHTFASNSQYQHIITELGEIDTSGWTSLSGMFSCRLYRDATVDTYTGEVALLEADFHYQKDTVGSTQEFVK